MVRKILRVLVFVFGLSGLALAGGHLENEKTPENSSNIILMRLMRRTRKNWIRFSPRPFQRIRNGETVSYNSWREYIDFDMIKKTGWERSIIDETEIVYDSDKTAVVRIIFSRLDASDKIVAKAEAAMVVVKPDSQWKLATIFAPGSIPVSEEDK